MGRRSRGTDRTATKDIADSPALRHGGIHRISNDTSSASANRKASLWPSNAVPTQVGKRSLPGNDLNATLVPESGIGFLGRARQI